MRKQNKRATISECQLILWPDANGLLILPTNNGASRIAVRIKPRSARSALLLRASLRLPRKREGKISNAFSFFSSSRWRSLSSRIGYSFSTTTEIYFVTWLTSRILEAEFGALSIERMTQEAGDVLGLNAGKINEFLIKHTRARARFKSDGEMITFR